MPLSQVFVSIEDPRSARHVRHDLSELLTVAVCAMLCGADDCVEISAWGQERLDWLRRFLVLENGVASHDTFARVFALLDPLGFEAAFRRWVGMILPVLRDDQVVAIDGKTSRRSSNKADAHPLHLVSAFAADIGVVLGQIATEEKSNEITAIPDLLATLALQGCIVTIDAMGTQTNVAKAIRARGADYVLCVKDNHPKLLESFLLAQAGVGGKLEAISCTQTTTSGHGRSEIRRCWAFDAVDRLYKFEQWQDIKSFAIVERHRTVGEHTSVERRYYLSSLAADAQRIAHAVRSHWEIENRLHWCLDVQMGDDQSRLRADFAANNLAVLRHIVMNLIRLNTTRKASIKTKRLLAATSDQFREDLLGFRL